MPGHLQRDFLVAQLRHVAHDPRKASEKLLHRHHANLHHGFLQLVQHPRLKRQRIGKLAAQRILRKPPLEFRDRPLQHRFPDDQLAHQIHHRVDAPCVHAQSVFRTACANPAGAEDCAVIVFIRFARCRGISGFTPAETAAASDSTRISSKSRGAVCISGNAQSTELCATTEGTRQRCWIQSASPCLSRARLPQVRRSLTVAACSPDAAPESSQRPPALSLQARKPRRATPPGSRCSATLVHRFAAPEGFGNHQPFVLRPTQICALLATLVSCAVAACASSLWMCSRRAPPAGGCRLLRYAASIS